MFTVSVIFALHMFLLAGVLIQGCKRQDQAGPGAQGTALDELEPLSNTAPEQPDTAGTAPQFNEPLPPEPVFNAAPAAPTNLPPALPGIDARTPDVATSPAVNTPPEIAKPAPLPPTEPPAPARTVTYEVKRGDNLTRIAKNHGTTVKAIREANGLKTDRILVGQKLKVPAP